MNKGITVKQLYKHLAEVIKRGSGDKHILISCDDEGNGYHALFYGVNDSVNDIEMCRNYGMLHDDIDPKEVVLLG